MATEYKLSYTGSEIQQKLNKIDSLASESYVDGVVSTKLDNTQLTSAINTALAQAKASGEFDGTNGKDGVSATHSWNGTTLTVTSASGTSSANLKGDKGDSIKGADGVSISSVKQTTTSSADGGSNVVTVTLSNGTTSTFTVKNGSKGSDGINGTNGTNGKDGKTPVKGVDYFTAADQEAIVQQVIAALGTPVFGRVDADNNIILTGELADGTYTIKYEDAEGEVIDIGSIVLSDEVEIPITWGKGKINTSNGTVDTSDASYAYSEPIQIASGKKYTLNLTNVAVSLKLCYYNASGGFISATAENLWTNTGGSGIAGSTSLELPIVSGTASIRIRCYLNYLASGDSYTALVAGAKLIEGNA